MSKQIIIDFEQELPFDVTPWTITRWDGDTSLIGIKSKAISHNQSTFFEITAKFDYIKIEYIVSSETNYDKFSFYVDGTRKVYTGTTTNSYEETFTDNVDHTLKFMYSKDGSNSSGYDAAFIKSMIFSTVDDSLKQKSTLFGIQAEDGIIYTIDANKEIIKIADSIDMMDKDKYLSFTNDQSIININAVEFGKNKKLLYYSEFLDRKPHMVIKGLRNPGVVKMRDSFILDYVYVDGIENFTIDIKKSEGDLAKIMFSIDGGKTWSYLLDDIWNTTESLNDEIMYEKGIDIDMITNLSNEQLEYLFTNKLLKVAIYLKPKDLDSALKIDGLTCKFSII